ncbi:TPA: hypothetical protein ACJISE_000882 [Campylobacter jejuni]
MVNFDTQYANINYPNNNTSNKKAVLKNDDDAYYESIIKNLEILKNLKKKMAIMDLLM